MHFAGHFFVVYFTTDAATNNIVLQVFMMLNDSTQNNLYFTINNVTLEEVSGGEIYTINQHSSLNKYRFGFNCAENLNEVKGYGNTPDLGDRWHDPRLGKLIYKIDRKASQYPWQSPYAYYANSPIWQIDYNGEGNPPYYESAVKPTQQSVNNFFTDKRINAILKVSTEQDINVMLLMRVIYRENTSEMAVKPLGKIYNKLIFGREILGGIKSSISNISNYDTRSTGIVQIQLKHVIRLEMGMSEEEYDTWKVKLLSSKAGKTTFARHLTHAEFLLNSEQHAIDFAGRHIKELLQLNPNSTDDDIHRDYIRGVENNRNKPSLPEVEDAINRTNNTLPLLENRLEDYEKKEFQKKQNSK